MSTAQPKAETSLTFAGDEADLKIQLTISPLMFETLLSLSKETGSAISDLMAKAIALLTVAQEANENGKQLGIVSGGEVETVIDVF